MSITINDAWSAELENLRSELSGIGGSGERDASGRSQYLRAKIDEMQDGPSRSMVHDMLESEIGAHDVLDVSTDDAGRYVIAIERDARREFVREELDGTLTGPMSEGDWSNLRASE